MPEPIEINLNSKTLSVRAFVATPKGIKQEEMQDLQWHHIPGDDLDEHFKTVFGPRLGEVYSRLFQDVCRIHEKWVLIKQIYASFDLLSRLDQDSKQFVWRLLRIFGDDLTLHLARLTDKARMGPSENLSLLTIVDLLDDPTAKSTIPPLIEDATNKAEKARVWRNKFIAHRDKIVSLGNQELDQLPHIDEKYMEKALAAAGEVLTQMYGIYSGSPIEMQSWAPTGTAESIDSFLNYIKFALFCMNNNKQGKYLVDEFNAMERIHLYR